MTDQALYFKIFFLLKIEKTAFCQHRILLRHKKICAGIQRAMCLNISIEFRNAFSTFSTACAAHNNVQHQITIMIFRFYCFSL